MTTQAKTRRAIARFTGHTPHGGWPLPTTPDQSYPPSELVAEFDESLGGLIRQARDTRSQAIAAIDAYIDAHPGGSAWTAAHQAVANDPDADNIKKLLDSHTGLYREAVKMSSLAHQAAAAVTQHLKQHGTTLANTATGRFNDLSEQAAVGFVEAAVGNDMVAYGAAEKLTEQARPPAELAAWLHNPKRTVNFDSPLHGRFRPDVGLARSYAGAVIKGESSSSYMPAGMTTVNGQIAGSRTTLAKYPHLAPLNTLSAKLGRPAIPAKEVQYPAPYVTGGHIR